MTKYWTSDGVVVADDGLVEVNACLANKSFLLVVIEDFDTLFEQASVAALANKVRTFNDVLLEGKNPVSSSHLVLFLPIPGLSLSFVLFIISALLLVDNFFIPSIVGLKRTLSIFSLELIKFSRAISLVTSFFL